MKSCFKKFRRSSHQGCSLKAPVLKKAYNFIKKRLQHRCVPVKSAKVVRTPILKNNFKRLLLKVLTKQQTLREKCPKTELFLVRIFPHLDCLRWVRFSPYSVWVRENTDQKQLRIWTLFTQWKSYFRNIMLRMQEFSPKTALKNLANFTPKHLCQSLSLFKSSRLQACCFLHIINTVYSFQKCLVW